MTMKRITSIGDSEGVFAIKSVDYDIARDNEELFDIEMDANANGE